MAALDFPASPTLNQVYSANGRSWIWDGTAWNPYGSGIADGDRGDITVSAGGSQWTIDPAVVTYDKIQDVSAASRLLGRGSASGAGDVEEISIGSGLSMTGTTLSATGGGSGTVTSVDVSGGTTGLTTSGGPVTTSGTITLAGTLAIANGGTGQTAQTAAFDALAPTTTKGDLIVHNGTDNIRVAVGVTNGHVLTVDSAEASGVKWAAASGGGAKYAVLSSDFSTSNDTTLQNITGLSFSMAANTAYFIRAEFGYTANATTTGIGIGVSGPASPTRVVLNGIIGQTAATFAGNTTNTYGLIAESLSSGGSATSRLATISGLIVNGANAGTFQLQAKSESGTAGTVTLLAGGALVWMEVTT